MWVEVSGPLDRFSVGTVVKLRSVGDVLRASNVAGVEPTWTGHVVAGRGENVVVRVRPGVTVNYRSGEHRLYVWVGAPEQAFCNGVPRRLERAQWEDREWRPSDDHFVWWS